MIPIVVVDMDMNPLSYPLWGLHPAKVWVTTTQSGVAVLVVQVDGSQPSVPPVFPVQQAIEQL